MDKKQSSKPTRVGDVIGSVLSSLGIDQRSPQARIMGMWQRTVGPDIAEHTRPAEMKRGVLIVHVDSSPWFTELNRNHKDRILTKLKELVGEKNITDVKFRVGEI